MDKNYNNKKGKLQFLFVVFIAVLYSTLVLITTLPKNVSATTVEKETNTVTAKPLDDNNIEETFNTNPIQENSSEQQQEKTTEEALIEQGYYRTDVPLSYELQDTLHCVCDKYNVNYELALGLIQVESNFNEDSESDLCYGLMALNKEYFPENLTPAENIEAGIKHFSQKIEKYDGDIEAALTAYNVGHDNGSRYYAKRVLEFAKSWGYEV